MIIEAAELSPSQKAVIEELLGRQLLDREAISLRPFDAAETTPGQSAAAEHLRAFLERPRPGRRADVPDAELDEALLEALRSERPHYTPVP